MRPTAETERTDFRRLLLGHGRFHDRDVEADFVRGVVDRLDRPGDDEMGERRRADRDGIAGVDVRDRLLELDAWAREYIGSTDYAEE